MGSKCILWMICILILYSICLLAWTIVGSVMFWGKLNPAGLCLSGPRTYMYGMLVINYVGICVMCLHNINKPKRTRIQDNE